MSEERAASCSKPLCSRHCPDQMLGANPSARACVCASSCVYVFRALGGSGGGDRKVHAKTIPGIGQIFENQHQNAGKPSAKIVNFREMCPGLLLHELSILAIKSPPKFENHRKHKEEITTKTSKNVWEGDRDNAA